MLEKAGKLPRTATGLTYKQKKANPVQGPPIPATRQTPWSDLESADWKRKTYGSDDDY